ncbi:hypothetical protein GUJ93_ZPchr0002g23490 [Zizania palustris]|uniref:Uncharacterized protein n=1 Tax=Zizania palustris TaxID=103762 RepID=A0A8J5VE90_ZIZPA|nr:hypothetical protein GUJ93_ZPchr0002g23490 [Zizania palustris]
MSQTHILLNTRRARRNARGTRHGAGRGTRATARGARGKRGRLSWELGVAVARQHAGRGGAAARWPGRRGGRGGDGASEAVTGGDGAWRVGSRALARTATGLGAAGDRRRGGRGGDRRRRDWDRRRRGGHQRRER